MSESWLLLGISAVTAVLLACLFFVAPVRYNGVMKTLLSLGLLGVLTAEAFVIFVGGPYIAFMLLKTALA
jgi:hypothetical protein